MTVKPIIEIPSSKKKVTLIIIGALAFVAVGIWFVIKSATLGQALSANSIIILFVGLVSILFFGVCAFSAALKLFDNRPGLMIDNTGINDNSSGISSGQILWTDIEKVSVVTIQKQKLIMVYVKNPQQYIDKQTSGFKRKMMSLNYKMYGTPLSITSNGLKTSFEELYRLVTSNLATSRQFRP